MSCDVRLCLFLSCFFFFFKQKTAYEMRISDWSSDVCSSDLQGGIERHAHDLAVVARRADDAADGRAVAVLVLQAVARADHVARRRGNPARKLGAARVDSAVDHRDGDAAAGDRKSTRLNSSH